jgi:rfaE bifunctional protein kinase chain/domain
VNNIKELGGSPYPFGILGKDFPGRTLISIMNEKGIDTQGILVEEEHTTFVKQRVVAGSPHSVKQQILRIDRCLPVEASSSYHSKISKRAQSMLSKMDAFIVSDYGLGIAQPVGLQPILEELRKQKIPCFVDSRHNLTAYSGITAATPNEPEVETILGKTVDTENLSSAGNEILQKLDAKALIITRGKNGMMLFTSSAEPVSIPIFGSPDIVDVTGAGDTVISTFAMAVSAGISFYDAARLANCAAGIVVMKRGAATVTQDELREAIQVASLHE